MTRYLYLIILGALYTIGAQARLLVLGDSYASGNGARAADGTPNYAGVSDCFKSVTSFGGTVGTLANVTTVNRGCSGGKLRDILNPRTLTGSVAPINGTCPSSSFAPEEFYAAGSRPCLRSVKPQIEAVNQSVDLVLFAAGGNDLIFGSLVEKCLFFGGRNATECQQNIDFIRNSLPNFATTLTSVLLAIEPLLKAETKIVVLGYPHIVQNVPFVFNEISGSGSIEITNNLRSLGNALEAAQLNAVRAANQGSSRTFVDFFSTKALFEGHEPHPSSFTTNSNSWIWETEWEISGQFFQRAETYHLNPTGHFKLGQALARTYFGIIPPTTAPTKAPTKAPAKPTTKVPTKAPNTKKPTKAPTKSPTVAPMRPSTRVPTKSPTKAPTKAPMTRVPTKSPTKVPTKAPMRSPTRIPTKPPTKAPTKFPIKVPSKAPVNVSTKAPVRLPTRSPTGAPVNTSRKCKGPLRCLLRLLFGGRG